MTSSFAEVSAGVKHIGDSARGAVPDFNEVIPPQRGRERGAASGTASARGNPFVSCARRSRRAAPTYAGAIVHPTCAPIAAASRPRSTRPSSPAACSLYRTPFTTGVRHDGTGSAHRQSPLYTRARGRVNPSHRGACARIHDVYRRNVDRMNWLTPLNERGCPVLNSNHQSYLYSKHCPAPLHAKVPTTGAERHIRQWATVRTPLPASHVKTP